MPNTCTDVPWGMVSMMFELMLAPSRRLSGAVVAMVVTPSSANAHGTATAVVSITAAARPPSMSFAVLIIFIVSLLLRSLRKQTARASLLEKSMTLSHIGPAQTQGIQ